jgi:SpoVK/Ycf46/Vps4 family AAA+-type ATPase
MQQLSTYIKAGYACIQIVTAEEERTVNAIIHMAKKDLANKKERPDGYAVWTWAVTKGLRNERGKLVDGDKEELQKSKDPVVALALFMAGGVDSRSIVILKDFHMYLKQVNPMLIRLLKECITSGRQTNRHLIIVGCQLNMQPELEKEIQSIDLPLPSRDDLKQVATSIAKSAKKEITHMEVVLESMTGLTTNEAADAISYSIAESKRICPKIISRIKTDTIRRNGIVELIDADVTLDDIGGLDRYKKHLTTISKSFTPEAKEYGLPQPQSIIAVGNPGTGKSMSSMACKTVFSLPLLRLEAGRIFGSFVGESEKNWRSAFSTAKAIAPVVMWIDEAEGLFVGAKSSGQCDGGTTNRVVKAVLQDMQMNSEGVFFVFTSNDIDGFPDALIDRCDVWAFDLPSLDERESIWSIHIKKRKRNPKSFNLKSMAEKSDGFSGRQIEQAWLKAMTVAFNDKKREPTDEDVEATIKQFIPTSITMKTQIEKRRERLKNRAQSAS